MRLVVDTNVWIAGLVAEGLCRDIVKRRLPRHQLVTSKGLLDELTDKLRQKFRLNPDELPLITAYHKRAILVEPLELASAICRDPNDDLVLATALCGRADAILTGDKDLLVLETFQNIPILSPRQFVEGLAD